FRFAADPLLIERYVQANLRCLASLSDQESRMVREVVLRRLDPEAIELALRLRRPKNALTQKLQILFYLVEVRSRYLSLFVNDRDRFLRALSEMVWSLFRTFWKFMKGSRLIRRHSLV